VRLGNLYTGPGDVEFDLFLEVFFDENEEGERVSTAAIPKEFLYDLTSNGIVVGRDLLPFYKDSFRDQTNGMVFSTWYIDYDDRMNPRLRIVRPTNRFLASPVMNGKQVRSHSIGIKVNERTS
jgi:hypothetical protein